MDYSGKGNPRTYWINTGRHFGFPDCCIQSFLDDDIPETTPYDGTGFRSCKECSKKPKEVLVAEINNRRTHPYPFPDDRGFLENYQESMYGD